MSARELRAMLAHALLDAGPDAPTLCEGWRTRHLAAHLVLREHASWRMAGLLIPPLRDSVERLTLTTGDAAREPEAYRELVARFEAGPGRCSPWRLIDDLANVVEYAVHIEDVTRADGGPGTHYPPPLAQEIWRSFAARAGVMLRGSGWRAALLVDDADGGGRLAVGASRRHDPLVIVRGRAIDLVLLGFGRAADVTVSGPLEAVAAFRSSCRGF